MADKPYKTRQTIAYTEDVYYDANGEEVCRIRRHDDWCQDESRKQDVTPQEIEDFYDD